MGTLDQTFVNVAGTVARLVEVAAVFFVAVGALFAAYRAVLSLFRGGSVPNRRSIWLHFASWLLLALEFELASDIIRSIITPSWQQIGQLGAVAAIRTLLSYFLGRDMTNMQT